MAQRFVYVARLKTGDEVPLRRVLEHLPDEALGESDLLGFQTYVGSGYCVFSFELRDGDFQDQFAHFSNDARVHEFFARVSEYLIEGEQIAKTFAAGDAGFHASASRSSDRDAITSGDLPLAAEVSSWAQAAR